jgi:hypothetical protein
MTTITGLWGCIKNRFDRGCIKNRLDIISYKPYNQIHMKVAAVAQWEIVLHLYGYKDLLPYT